MIELWIGSRWIMEEYEMMQSQKLRCGNNIKDSQVSLTSYLNPKLLDNKFISFSLIYPLIEANYLMRWNIPLQVKSAYWSWHAYKYWKLD